MQRYATFHGLTLAILMLIVQQAAGQEASPEKMAELADKQVAVKKAAVRLATAHLGIARARLDAAKAAVQTARAAVDRWESEVRRMRSLVNDKVIDQQTLKETESRLATAQAKVAEATANVAVAEQQVRLEDARVEIAVAEVDEAVLRLQQLRAGQPKNEAATNLLKIQLKAAETAQRASQAGLLETKRTVNGMLVFVGRPADAHIWSVRWLHAQRDLSQTRDERLAAFADHLKRMKELQQVIVPLTKDLLPRSEASAAEWYVAEAELWLLQERAK